MTDEPKPKQTLVRDERQTFTVTIDKILGAWPDMWIQATSEDGIALDWHTGLYWQPGSKYVIAGTIRHCGLKKTGDGPWREYAGLMRVGRPKQKMSA